MIFLTRGFILPNGVDAATIDGYGYETYRCKRRAQNQPSKRLIRFSS